MQFEVQTIRSTDPDFPPLLKEIPEPPEVLYIRGTLPRDMKYLAVVGSRNYTNYGKQVTEALIQGLRGYNVTIVSGLALGIDALAHEAALDAGLSTIAVPGSGIDDSVLYPRRNRGLAMKILEHDGALLSEFPPDFEATPWSFPKRNRIMAGLSHAVLLIEATEKSGTLITARLTVDYNRELLAVPGNIFSLNTKGTHQFIKLGAALVSSPEDILLALGFEADAPHADINRPALKPEMLAVIEALTSPKDRDVLIRSLPYSVEVCGVLLMEMELEGFIREENGVFFRL